MRRSRPPGLQVFLLSIASIVWISIGWISNAGADSAAGPLLRARLDKTVAVPGQVLSLEITILVPTWMPKPPELPTFDLPDVSVRLPEGSSRPTMERIDGETWSGVTREYQISPMVVGRFRLPPQTITITYADPETRAPIVVKRRTKEFVFEGRAPDGARDLDPFIAAETLSIEQTIEGDPENLEPGLVFTRVVTARLTGASPIFLPRLIPKLEADGLAAYPKEPDFNENSNRGVTTGERVESVTYVAEAGGRFTAAPIRLRWWNLRTKKIEVAELPALAIVSRGPPPAVISPSVDLRDWLFRLVAGGLLVVLLAAVGGRLWPRYVERRLHRREQRLASEAFAFEAVTRAMQGRRFGEAIRAIELWSMRLSMIAEEDRGRLFEPLHPLAALLYGRSHQVPSKADWSEALAALRRERNEWLAKSRDQLARRVLPVLNPDSAILRRA